MNNIAKIRFFFIIPLVCVGLFSCNPEEPLPPETILEYVEVQHFVDATSNLVDINVRVSYQNGKGNLGFLGRDTTDNLFIHVFDRISLTDTIYEPMQDGHPTEPKNVVISFAIPNLTPQGQKSVRGMLDIGFGANFIWMQMFSRHGIVRFEIYMYDRDLVKSNTVVTPDIRIR
jgi:hypothetical protein